MESGLLGGCSSGLRASASSGMVAWTGSGGAGGQTILLLNIQAYNFSFSARACSLIICIYPRWRLQRSARTVAAILMTISSASWRRVISLQSISRYFFIQSNHYFNYQHLTSQLVEPREPKQKQYTGITRLPHRATSPGRPPAGCSKNGDFDDIRPRIQVVSLCRSWEWEDCFIGRARSFTGQRNVYGCSVSLAFVSSVVLQFYMQVQSYVGCIAFETVGIRTGEIFLHLKRLPSVALKPSPTQQLLMILKQTLIQRDIYLHFGDLFLERIELCIAGLKFSIAKLIEKEQLPKFFIVVN